MAAKYASGTMKIKNAENDLVDFHPNTKLDCIKNYQTNESLDSIVEDLQDGIDEAKSSGSVKVLDAKPDSETFYDDVSNESLCVVFSDDDWKLTVKSRRYTTSDGVSSNGYYSAIPFNLYGADEDAVLEVDWGDGTSSVLTRSDYTSSNRTASMHKYAGDAGETVHNISISSPDFSKTYLMSCSTSLYSDDTQRIVNRAFRNTLVSVDTPIPYVAGITVYANDTGTSFSRDANSMESLFFGCEELESVCAGLFSQNPDVTNFNYIFCQWQSENTKMKSLPYGLLKYNTKAKNFYRGFYCMCFESIPEDLFKYTNEDLMITAAFTGPHSWTPIRDVPTNLFWYNKSITSFSSMYLQCDEFDLRIGSPVVQTASYMFETGHGNSDDPVLDPTKRIVRVPNGSLTHSTFNALTDDLKITVIGE